MICCSVGAQDEECVSVSVCVCVCVRGLALADSRQMLSRPALPVSLLTEAGFPRAATGSAQRSSFPCRGCSRVPRFRLTGLGQRILWDFQEAFCKGRADTFALPVSLLPGKLI